VAQILTDSLHRPAAAIAANDFTDTEAAIGAWAAGYGHEEVLPTGAIDLLKPTGELLNQAVAAGFGDEGIAAVIKVLRKTNQST
jgi:hypothetical protein